LTRDWRDSGFRKIGDESEIRDTLNIIFSMQAQTDKIRLKRVVILDSALPSARSVLVRSGRFHGSLKVQSASVPRP